MVYKPKIIIISSYNIILWNQIHLENYPDNRIIIYQKKIQFKYLKTGEEDVTTFSFLQQYHNYVVEFQLSFFFISPWWPSLSLPQNVYLLGSSYGQISTSSETQEF